MFQKSLTVTPALKDYFKPELRFRFVILIESNFVAEIRNKIRGAFGFETVFNLLAYTCKVIFIILFYLSCLQSR
jgi:hypothetical protein